MSTIKSSSEHLTLNADGASKDIKFQANGVEKASISSAGAFTSTTIDATALTGTIPSFTSTGIDDNATSTAIIIDSSENTSLVGKSTNTGYDTYLKIYGNSAPTSNVNRWAGLAVYNNGGNNVNELAFFTGSGDSARTEQAKLGTSGNLTLQGGIKFNGDTAAANALDDYEEGTWTPAITMGSGTATLTATTGRYTKIGRMVTASIDAHVASVSTPSGSCTVNLPFTTNSVVRECVVFHTYGHTIPTGESHTIAQTLDSQSNLNLLYGGGTTTPSFVPSAGTYFTLTLTYEAA